jgi:hypothetical protein
MTSIYRPRAGHGCQPQKGTHLLMVIYFIGERPVDRVRVLIIAMPEPVATAHCHASLRKRIQFPCMMRATSASE